MHLSRWINLDPDRLASSRGLSGLIPAGNLAGLPALSLPCGFADGLPIAISLVGRPFYENQLIAVGDCIPEPDGLASAQTACRRLIYRTKSRSTLDPATPVNAGTKAGPAPLRRSSPWTA